MEINYKSGLTGFQTEDGVRYVVAAQELSDKVITTLATEANAIFFPAIDGVSQDEFCEIISCTSPKGVRISQSYKDLTCLQDKVLLEEIILPRDVKSFDDFSNLKNLKIFEGQISEIKSNIECCNSLKNLTLHKLKTKSKSFESINLPGSLLSLKVNLGNIVSTNGIKKVSDLKHLSFEYMSKLEDLSELPELKELRDLELYSCKKALNNDVFKALSSLETLKLNNCGKIENLEFVKYLSSLRKFTFVNTVVENDDLSPLLDCKNLEYAGFMDKRSYNLTFDLIHDKLRMKT
ncbi:hypothetical protein [Aliikangiella sp. G2MR2-5]|uniref:hypothetical protein n=1 Tax=Aliikangiella sp. G2MR2-5 TaxID=2788943 RepID=UPI0018AAFDA3|nr:hypothetical protein [Aliikangiella sp. G2MR2-5]